MFNYATRSRKKDTTKTQSGKFIFHSAIDWFDQIFILFPLVHPIDRVTRSAEQLLNFPTRRYPVIGITRRKLGRQRIEFQGGVGGGGKKFFPTIHDGGRQRNGER